MHCSSSFALNCLNLFYIIYNNFTWNPINRIDESGTAVVELNIFLPILVVPVLLLRDESFENDPH